MYRKKSMAAVILVIAIAAGSTFTEALSVNAAETASEKEEVIYVMTDANGKVDSVNVVNIFGKGDVTDYGNYSAVKMLTSTAEIKQENDKITFSNEDEKVYYQGTLENAQIPWNIKITYTLDGKQISPEELAGKSGSLKIHISITENTKCDSSFYENYALQAAFTLNTKQCENIVAEGATLANVGSDKQISYTVLPGKGLDADITADVTDFEMDAAAINGVKLDLAIDIDDEELMDKVGEIQDATAKLNDGAKEVKDGTGKLVDGGSSLDDGAKSLYDGAASLDTGIDTLSEGITTVQDGLNTLNAKSGDLTGGSAKVLDALKTIQSSLSGVSVSTDQLKTLTDSSASIKKGISDLYDGAAALQASLSYESYKAAMSQNGLDIDQLQSANQTTIASMTTQLQNLQTQLEGLQQQIAAAAAQGADTAQLKQQAAMMQTQIQTYGQILQLLQGNSAAIGGTESYFNAVSGGAASLVSGLAELKTNYEQFDAAIATLADTLSGLAVNMSTLKSGIDQLVTQYQTLDTGINDYTTGVATIVSGYTKLTEGAETLSNGSKELVNGSKTLKDGTSDLYAGVQSLYDGTVSLNDGTKEFYGKTYDMDTQVQDQIDEMISSLSGTDEETVSFVSEKNTNVDAVQFVIKTAAVEKTEVETEETVEEEPSGFWQKLIHLFGIQ